MRSALSTFILIVALALPNTLNAQKAEKASKAKAAIMSVIRQQEAGWNAGSLEEYMKGYANSPGTRFISGGSITLGYDTVLARYRRGYPDVAAMGKLTFSEIEIELLNPKEALVYGKWALKRDKDNPWGMFTLLFRKMK